MRIISGEYGRRRFDVPGNITARPTTDFARENIFNVITNNLELEGTRCLDLFAGTGAVTFELLSRGAAQVVAIEKAPVQSRFISEVAAKLRCQSRLTLLRGDVFRRVKAMPENEGFDLIFADPPYDLPQFEEVAPLVLDHPGLLRQGGLFILEHSAKRDYSANLRFVEHRAYGSVNFSLFR